ncbi:NACHT domain-containing protein [Bosea sp. ASV33]|uniref:NACHT domain-containing protein n=1 Tax=Bosea sp. ASV33 TaxID=2795106 RepID=UPI0018EAD061|nr:NACHT domain-containing protein [Bosea sp. ASV33]
MTVNENAIISAVISDLIRKSFNYISEGASSKLKSAWAKIFEDFKPFMEECYLKNTRVRIICKKDSDVSFEDIYVKSFFQSGDNRCDDDELIQKITDGRRIVINGNGGAGKTFFMRHLWITLFRSDTGVTPIFIELRQLNDVSSPDLKTFIRKTIAPNTELSEDIFDYFCNSGKLCLILDGFDEIKRDKRDAIQKQILALATTNQDCRVVVSSRYEYRFAGWNNFDVYESMPFTFSQSRELISVVPFDKNTKKLFLKRLDETFYKKNKSFLSNPLLCIMMLMTFRENMDIPNKMSIFYDQAFTTLYQWHDATKAYTRIKSLDIHDFQRSFGIFCLLSYHAQKFQFSRTEIIALINRSSKVCGLNVSADDILSDYEESVNLIRQEGMNYVFIHRSFQEYFCAYALMVVLPAKFSDFLPQISARTTDSVLPLCFEMNRNLVIDNYIAPKHKYISKLISQCDKSRNQFPYLTKLQISFNFRLAENDEDEKEGKSYDPVDVSLHVEGDQTALEFIDNIERIRNGKRPAVFWNGVVKEIIFRAGIFNLFDNIDSDDIEKREMYISIRFADNKIMIQETLEYSPSETISEIETGRIFDLVQQRKQIFLECQSETAAAIKKIADWCKKEIADEKSRGKSLDEILES